VPVEKEGKGISQLYSATRDAWITTHLPTLEGRKVELAWLAGPQRTFYPQNGNP